MRVERTILVLAALTFAGFGAAFALFTSGMAALVDIDLRTDTARTDFAATYGGFELGFAAFLLLAARTDAWVRPGLVASGCALAGFAAVRLAGMLMSSEIEALMSVAFGGEALGSGLSFWAARRYARRTAMIVTSSATARLP